MIHETSLRTVTLIVVMIVLIVGAVLLANWLMTGPWEAQDYDGHAPRLGREYFSIP